MTSAAGSEPTPAAPPGAETERLLDEALELYRNGNLEFAHSPAMRAVQLAPASAAAQALLGAILWELGRLSEATAALTKSLTLNPREPYARLSPQAREMLDAALAQAPDFVPLVLANGYWLLDQGELEPARAQFARAAELAPRDAAPLVGLARALLRLERRQEAEALVDRILEIDPGNVDVRNLLSHLHEDSLALLQAQSSLAKGDFTTAGGILAQLFDLKSSDPALQTLLMMRALAPAVDVRLRRLQADRIAPLTTGLELHLCEREAAASAANRVDIFYCAAPAWNAQLQKMWERTVYVLPAAQRVDALQRGLPSLKMQSGEVSLNPRDTRGLLATTVPHLSFTAEEELQGQAGLRSLGISAGAAFVCLDENGAPDGAQAEQVSRVAGKATDVLTERGYAIVRMSPGQTPPPGGRRPIIDYARSGLRSDFLDLYLLAHCAFYLGSDAGPYSVPELFRRPYALANVVTLDDLPTWNPWPFIPRRLWLTAERRWLTLREIFECGAARFRSPQQFAAAGIEPVENTAEELRALAVEMEERLRGVWVAREADENRQQRYWDIFREYASPDQHGVYRARIGTEFLRQNAYLLDETGAAAATAPGGIKSATPEPTLSLLMSNYNQAKYLPAALDILLDQSDQASEFVIVDDASTDNSLEIIERYAARATSQIEVVRLAANRGANANINWLLQRAKSEYVYFPAADDQIHPGFLEKSLKLLARHPEAGLCCTRSARLDDSSGQLTENSPDLCSAPAYLSPDECARLIREGGRFIIEGNTAVYKRSALLAANGFMDELKWHSDWFALLVIALQQGICHVPEYLAVNRMRPDSYSGRGIRDWTQQQEVVRAVLHHFALLDDPAVIRRIAYSNVLSFLVPPASLGDDRTLRLKAGHPYDGESLMRIGQLFLEQAAPHRSPTGSYGNLKFALVLFDTALEILGPVRELNYWRAVALFQTGRLGDARAAVASELALQPGHRKSEVLLAEIDSYLAAVQGPAPSPAAQSPSPLVLQHAALAQALADVVIPVYGQADLLRRCVESVLRTEPRAHLVLVDDCSPGGEILALFEAWRNHPQVTLARTPANLGFIGTCRLGADQGRAPYILFLNSDTEAQEPGWLEKLLPVEDAVAIVGAKLVYPPDMPGPLAGTLQHAGVARNAEGVPYHPFLGQPADTPGAAASHAVNAVTGACFLVRRQVWTELGGWDERFGKGVYEDVDFCWRARQKGHRVLYQPAACLYHRESASKAQDGQHALNAHTQENLKKLLDKWGRLASDEALFFDEKTVRRWERARKQVKRAQAATGQHNAKAALTALRKALEIAGDLPEALVSYAQLLAAQSDHVGAAEHFARAVQAMPAAWELRLRLVDEWLAAAQPEKAAAELAQLRAVFPQAADVRQREVQLAPYLPQKPVGVRPPAIELLAAATKPVRSAPAQPVPAASDRAAKTLEMLFAQPDLLAALQQNADKLDADLLALVRLNADTARSDGKADLAQGLDRLAAYIQQVVANPKGQLPSARPQKAAETLALLLEADDLPAALEQQAANLDADLLALVRANAAAARQEANADLAQGLDDLAAHVEGVIRQRAALLAQPAAPRAAETLETLLAADDVAVALEQNRDRLDEELANLVGRNAAAARGQGQAELADGLEALLGYIGQVVQSRQSGGDKPDAAQRLDQLLQADDLASALEQRASWLDADLLAVVQANARTARADGQTDLADGLDNLAAYIEAALTAR